MARLQAIQQLYVSKPFRELRRTLIVERGARCERCGAILEDPSQVIAHHRVEITLQNLNDPSVTLNPDNIELVCLTCHNKEHNRFGPVSHNVFLVYGPPLAGKSTFVRQTARRGDLMVDMDALWQAVSGQPIYDKPNNLRFNVFAVRGLLIDNIRTRYGRWNDAYLIGGYPQSAERQQLIAELGAAPIYCEATQEECLARLYQDPQRAQVRRQWEGYIHSWFDQYQE